MQAGAPGGAPQPAKTMFGYAAPQIPGQPPRPGQPAPGPAPAPAQAPRPGAPPQGFAPPQQQGFAPPPQQQGFAPPPQQGGPSYGAPPQQGGPSYGAPPQQPAGYPPPQQQPGGPSYGAPPQQQGFAPPQQQGYPPPQQPQGYPPPQQPGFAPPQQGGFAPPPQQGGYPPPPQQGGFAPPQQPAPYGQPPQQGFGAAPQPSPYGQPPQQQPGGPYGAPPQQQGGYPAAQQQYGDPNQQASAPGHFGSHIPASAPGTIFGFPVARLRDTAVQKKFLLMAGIALVASIFVPFSLSPFIGAWSEGIPKFEFLIFPIVAGGAYLLLTMAPADMRAKIPPIVLHWLPFGVAYAGIFISHMGNGFGALVMSMAGGHGGGGPAMFMMALTSGVGGLYILGYSLLVFGLLARIAQPEDQIARIIIAVGAGCLIPTWIDFFSVFGVLSVLPFMGTIMMLLWFVVLTVSVFCIVFVVPPAKLPPALKTVDAFGPVITAILIAWLPAQQVLMALGIIIHGGGVTGGILVLAHGLLPILAFFGVLMMASPAAYEEAKHMFSGKKGGSPPPPAAGGGYPPPQGGGYPPPQGGGYPPPQGGGYPPQQGGGGGWQ